MSCLRHDQPIKGISMVKGQILDDGHMLERHRQQVEAIDLELLLQELVERAGHLKPPQAGLDRELPTARDTEEALRSGDGFAGARRKRRRVPYPPEKRVRIEEDRHFM
jgi:hypothetical protein